MRLLFLFIFLIKLFLGFSQRTETALYFNKKNNRFVFDMDNDMLFSTDSYYTAGFGFSFTNQDLKKTPIQFIVNPNNKTLKSFIGFGLENRIYTPSSIVNPTFIENDQPYSAYILATNYSLIVNPEKHLKVSNEIGVGLMGPYAFGEEIQTIVHQVVGSPLPIGWDNQLRTTFLIDYRFRVEKGFGGKILANSVVPFFEARAGTLTDRLKVGIMIKLGNKHKYLKSSDYKNKIIWEWLFTGNFQGVLYDATLQGSLYFKDENSLSSSQVIHHQHQLRTGFNLYYNNLSLRYMINLNTANFSSAYYHRYGGINIGFTF